MGYVNHAKPLPCAYGVAVKIDDTLHGEKDMYFRVYEVHPCFILSESSARSNDNTEPSWYGCGGDFVPRARWKLKPGRNRTTNHRLGRSPADEL